MFSLNWHWVEVLSIVFNAMQTSDPISHSLLNLSYTLGNRLLTFKCYFLLKQPSCQYLMCSFP
jgi:hypothetical protein